MSLEHPPACFTGAPLKAAPPPNDDYWHGLINEKAAAKFLGQSVRTTQGYRYRGGGPRFYRLSVRTVRYKRIDLREWAEAHAYHSTSEYSKCLPAEGEP